MIPLAEDIEILTAGYLSALKSNSDEIVRLADALRAAEAERNQAVTDLVETRLALANSEACRAEAEKQMHAAERNILMLNQSRERLGNDVNAARANLDEARYILKCPDNTTLSDWCQHLADDLAASETIRLAAHKAATGKAVTG